MGPVVTWRKLTEMSVATTRSIGAPPKAITSPVLGGRAEERSSAPPPRNGRIRSCGKTSELIRRLHGVEVLLIQYARKWAEVITPSVRAHRSAVDTAVTSSAAVITWRASGSAHGPAFGSVAARRQRLSSPGRSAPPRLLDRARSGRGRDALLPPRFGGPWPGPGSGPLKMISSSRRARTFAARRNAIRALVSSGSATCAPRR